MKKIFIIIIATLFSLSLFGQNKFNYEIQAKGGLSIGEGQVKVDSIVKDGTAIIFYSQGQKAFPANRIDTIPLFTFSGGNGNDADSILFTTSTIYDRPFYNASSDTLVITELRAAMVSGTQNLIDTLAILICWNDTLNVTKGDSFLTLDTLGLDPPAVNSETVFTSFNNAKIAPGEWVWCKSPGVILGRKPKMLVVSISGYRKSTY